MTWLARDTRPLCDSFLRPPLFTTWVDDHIGALEPPPPARLESTNGWHCPRASCAGLCSHPWLTMHVSWLAALPLQVGGGKLAVVARRAPHRLGLFAGLFGLHAHAEPPPCASPLTAVPWLQVSSLLIYCCAPLHPSRFGQNAASHSAMAVHRVEGCAEAAGGGGRRVEAAA